MAWGPATGVAAVISAAVGVFLLKERAEDPAAHWVKWHSLAAATPHP